MDTSALQALFRSVADYAAERRSGDADRIHRPLASYAELLERFRLDVDDAGAPAEQVMADLIRFTEPGLAAMTGPRFYGWVIGGSDPVGVAADWLAGVWGQNTGNPLATPASAAVEAAAAAALLDLLDLPRESSVGLVTGATMANFTCLAAARSDVLRRAGWDVEADGLFGAPPITVIIGEEAHSTVFVSLKYLGLGANRVVKVAVDSDGAMLPDAFAAAIEASVRPGDRHRTGRPDQFRGHRPLSLHRRRRERERRVAPRRRRLRPVGARNTRPGASHGGHRRARTAGPSMATNGCRRPMIAATPSCAIAKRTAGRCRSPPATFPAPRTTSVPPADYVPELSRRARGFATWALIRHLGRKGIAEMVSRHCALARRFAERLAAEPGVEIHNTVNLNQVTVRFGGDDELTRRTIARIQSDGVCFVGGSEWRGRWIMRISVIGGATTEADVDRSIAAMISAWRAVSGRN